MAPASARDVNGFMERLRCRVAPGGRGRGNLRPARVTNQRSRLSCELAAGLEPLAHRQVVLDRAVAQAHAAREAAFDLEAQALVEAHGVGVAFPAEQLDPLDLRRERRGG